MSVERGGPVVLLVEDDPSLGDILGKNLEVRGYRVRRVETLAATLATLARDENVAQIVIGRSSHGRWHELLRGSVVTSLLRRVRDVDVRVIGEDTSHPDTP
jgi:K+-sensing histidine kinase KdpD